MKQLKHIRYNSKQLGGMQKIIVAKCYQQNQVSIATGTHESVGLDALLYIYKLDMGKIVYQQYLN